MSVPKITYHEVFDDEKLALTLDALADKYNEATRRFIYLTYTDPTIGSYYRGLRESGRFQKGGKSKVHRESIRFPNPVVYQFCDKVLSALYGPNWLQDTKALKHDLVRPWHIVEKL